jgi:ABC-type multidrug transport system permease subunit
MIILDTGGYMVYYGHPIDCISYFKTADNQVKSEEGECPVCGNSTPEIIFDIIEAQKVDEYGNFKDERKVTPTQWEERFRKNVTPEKIDDVTNEPPKNLHVPNWIRQFLIYLRRDVKSKVSNTQYIVLNLTEAPLLGFILSFLIRYTEPNKDHYVFFENENIVPYIFMSIIVALFLGLTVSAEEIFRDRKILKREEFLNLSRSSYLMAKVVILTTISAVQAILYVLVGNTILEFEWGMYGSFWLVLFSMFVFANMMGLNISSAFNSAVTIYIMIPLLMIPQMALGGSMFSFDKLNQLIGSVGKVPIIAELMPSRWSYEALMVKQFRDNKYEKDFYEVEKRRNAANYMNESYIVKLQEALDNATLCLDSIAEDDPEYDTISIRRVEEYNLALLREEIAVEMLRMPEFSCKNLDKLTIAEFDEDVSDDVRRYLSSLKGYFVNEFNKATKEYDGQKEYYNSQQPGYVTNRRNKYHNERLQEIVKNTFKNKIIRYGNRLIQQEEAIFHDADYDGFFGFRAHFYAPRKWFCGRYYDTYAFDVVVIWLFSLICYVTLYFDLLKKVVDWFGNINYSRLLKKKENTAVPVAAPAEAKASESTDEKPSEPEERRAKLKVVTDDKDDN